MTNCIVAVNIYIFFNEVLYKQTWTFLFNADFSEGLNEY